MNIEEIGYYKVTYIATNKDIFTKQVDIYIIAKNEKEALEISQDNSPLFDSTVSIIKILEGFREVK